MEGSLSGPKTAFYIGASLKEVAQYVQARSRLLGRNLPHQTMVSHRGESHESGHDYHATDDVAHRSRTTIVII